MNEAPQVMTTEIEPVPEKCPVCGKKVPRLPPDVARDLLTKHMLSKHAAEPTK